MIFQSKVKTVGSISSFMNEDFGENKKKKIDRKQLKVAVTSLLPLSLVPSISTYAQEPMAVPANSMIADKTLDIITHALDPIVQLLVAFSFPVASVVIIGSCFYFLFGNSERAWTGIQNAGLGYILIQLSPMFLNVLKQIGTAV